MGLRSGGALVACLRSAAAGCAVALALAPASASGIPDTLRPSLTYKVHGEITANCQLSQIGRDLQIVGLADPATDMARPASVKLPFEVACNSPVRLAMTSRHGGLKFEGAISSDTDFISLLSYSARLDLPGHSGALECPSSAMGPAQGNCHNDINQSITAGHGSVDVRVIPGAGLLLAGRYSDQVTITITPILGNEA